MNWSDSMKKSLKADLILIVVTIVWGAGFPVTKFALETITPMYIIALRFFIASLTLAIIFHKKIKEASKDIIKPSLILSLLLFSTYVFQTIGIQYTTASKCGFYIGLSVLFVPFFCRFYLKTELQPRIIISTLMAALGLFLLSYTGDGFLFNKGDFLSVLSSICYAWHLIFTGIFVAEHDGALLSVIQMAFICLFGFIAAFIFESIPSNISMLSFGSLLFMAVFCTALAFLAQTLSLKYTSATHVAIIFTMEPLFGAIAARFLLNEILSTKGIIGGFLIVTAMLLSEIDIKSFKKDEAV